MRKIFILIILVGLICVFTSCKPDGSKERLYTGVIISKGYEAPTSGYKSEQDAKYFVLMREDSLGKVIRVNVTIPTYYSLNEGQRTGFILSNWVLYYSGNTINMRKNLYEQ